jgi:hypothetical protein
MSEAFDPADYSFVVKRRGNPPKPWRWEIYCAGKAVPVERSPVFFESMAEAAKEGKKGPCTLAGETGGVTAAALPQRIRASNTPILQMRVST